MLRKSKMEIEAELISARLEIEKLRAENDRLEDLASDLSMELEDRKDIFNQRGKANVAMSKKIAELEAKLKGAVDREKLRHFLKYPDGIITIPDPRYPSAKLFDPVDILNEINSHRLDVDYEQFRIYKR